MWRIPSVYSPWAFQSLLRNTDGKCALSFPVRQISEGALIDEVITMAGRGMVVKQVVVLAAMMPLYGLNGRTTEKGELMYSTASQLFGKSLASELVSACERTPDDKVAEPKTVCAKVMENSGNEIASIRWYRPVKTTTTTSYGSVGRFEGTTALGNSVPGYVMGSTKSSRTKTLSLKKEAPPGVVKGFPIMERAAKREKHPEAYAEVGAAIFLGVMDGRIGYSEAKMLDCFKNAADLGSLNGLYSICVLYGKWCWV